MINQCTQKNDFEQVVVTILLFVMYRKLQLIQFLILVVILQLLKNVSICLQQNV